MLESISGIVTLFIKEKKVVTVNVGSLQGVQPTNIATILDADGVCGFFEVDHVEERSSLGKMISGKAAGSGRGSGFRPFRSPV